MQLPLETSDIIRTALEEVLGKTEDDTKNAQEEVNGAPFGQPSLQSTQAAPTSMTAGAPAGTPVRSLPIKSVKTSFINVKTVKIPLRRSPRNHAVKTKNGSIRGTPTTPVENSDDQHVSAKPSSEVKKKMREQQDFGVKVAKVPVKKKEHSPNRIPSLELEKEGNDKASTYHQLANKVPAVTLTRAEMKPKEDNNVSSKLNEVMGAEKKTPQEKVREERL